MTTLAVTAMQRLGKIPPGFWLKAVLVILSIVVAVMVLRRVMRMNKILLTILAGIVLLVVCFQWIYNRNEPAFLTPAVDKIAPFFPGKNSYNAKQKQMPKD